MKRVVVFFFFVVSMSSAHAQSASFFDMPVLQPNVQPGSAYVPNDIDGDGVSDMLWFDPTTSQFGYWTMTIDSNGDFHRAALRTFQVTMGYMIGALGDFNGDNRVDLVWTSANDDLYLWSSSGSGFRSTMIGTYPDGWKLLGAVDINGDGHPDLLWKNEATHQFGYWLMNGSKRIGVRTFDITPGYRIVAIGYFGQARRASLVWEGQDGDFYDWDAQSSGGFHSYFIGNLARAGDTYHLDAAFIMGQENDQYPSLWLVTLDSTEGHEESYSWDRVMDDQGHVLSNTLYDGTTGGWFPNSHRSGAIYYRPFGTYSAHPMSIMTGRGDYMPYPQVVEVSNINFESPTFSSSSFYKSLPIDWYVVGAPWYRNDQIYFGPSGG
ncbi:FG-GAP repeat domain-containing protein [Oleiagrimonas soli]|nr:VCBS repeat-containing protein [Oleiagrimonas soli]